MVQFSRWMWQTARVKLTRIHRQKIRFHIRHYQRFDCSLLAFRTPILKRNFSSFLQVEQSRILDIYPRNSPRSSYKKSLQKCRSSSSYPPQEGEDLISPEVQLAEIEGVSTLDDSFTLMEREVDEDVDALHLRTKLYPADSDASGILSILYEAASIQEVLDTIDKLPEVSVALSSQALVTLWDLQKLLFKLGLFFDPEKDFINKSTFIRTLRQNPIFLEKILKPVLENYKDLEDESLCASLLTLKRMNFELQEYEDLINECVRRKETLCLAGLSRLSVCLRSEYLYGQFVMGHFMPLVFRYVNNMNTDLDIRLVSILLKNTQRMLNLTISTKYLSEIEKIIEKNELELEVVTYCKTILILLELELDKETSFTLLRKVGMILTPKVQSMDIMELLTLQRLFLNPHVPFPLLEALLTKYLNLIEQEKCSPRLDLVASVAPFLKTKQRNQMKEMANEYMDKSDFSSAIHVLYTIVKNVRTNDKTFYDKYWNLILESLSSSRTPRKFFLPRMTIIAKNYLNFTYSEHVFSYRNLWLESVLKSKLLSYLDNYTKGVVAIMPSEFAVIMAFMTAFDLLFVDMQLISKLTDFAPNLKIAELYLISKGLDMLSRSRNIPVKYYEKMIFITRILEDECRLRLNDQNISNNDVTTAYRLLSVIKKVKGDESPEFQKCLRILLTRENEVLNDSKIVREVGSYYHPEAIEQLYAHIHSNIDLINPETVKRFLILTYNLGWEREDFTFEKFAHLIEKHWEKLGLGVIQAAIALGFHRLLKPELVNNIFTVDFLDQIDEELRCSGKNYYQPLSLRTTLMKLNRVVCLDVPDANLPWFHDKFCQNVISAGKPKNSYLHNEVFKVLRDVVGSESAIQSNVCNSHDYYYDIDFVLEFDENNKPIKKKYKTKMFSPSRDNSQDNLQEVKRKVAILVLPRSSFTKNVKNLRGGFKLKQRHLEMLGYHVVKVDQSHWEAMYMSEGLVKHNFLKSEISLQ